MSRGYGSPMPAGYHEAQGAPLHLDLHKALNNPPYVVHLIPLRYLQTPSVKPVVHFHLTPVTSTMSHLTPERPHTKQHLSYIALRSETPTHPMITRSHSRRGSVGTISDSGSPPVESRRAAKSTTLTSLIHPCDFPSSDSDTKDFPTRKCDDSDTFREIKAKAPSLAQLNEASQHLVTITNIIILFLLPFLALVSVWYILTSMDALPQSISAINSPFYYEFQRLARPFYPSDPLRYTLQQ